MKKAIFLIALLFSNIGLGQAISQLYEEANKSVVLIKVSEPAIYGQGHSKLLVDMKRIGSGFVVSENGDIMTASHVVQTAEEIIVKFFDGEEIPATVLYSYPSADVALIRLLFPKRTALKVAELSNSDNVKIGDQIFIIGAPFGLGQSLTVGYVSGKYLRKQVESGFVSTEIIQTDAAINEGSSGAPMFNMQGEVIGISSFILSNSKGFQGLGFAASSNIAKRLLLDERSMWTGIDAYLISDFLAEILNLPQKSGILVQKVARFSLGDIIGLKGGFYKMNIEGEELVVGGDILLSVDSIPLISEENLHKAWQFIQALKPKDTLKFEVLRKGKTLTLKKTIL